MAGRVTEAPSLTNASISDARGLAATIAYRVCYGWLRRQSPRAARAEQSFAVRADKARGWRSGPTAGIFRSRP